MIDLRPLLVVTGTLHVEGGEKNRVRKSSVRGDTNTQTRVIDRSVDKSRRDANVIVVDYGRRLKEKIALLRTPYGVLVDQAQREALNALIADSTRKIAEFKARYPTSTTRLANYVLVERLTGLREAAVAGWLAQKKRERDPEVLAVFEQLVRPALKVV